MSKSNIDNIEPKSFISKLIKFDIKNLEESTYRIDIQFHGMEHDGPSYEGRVFINNTNACNNTAKDISNGYVGSYFVFGHGECFGDVGHCDIRKIRSPFDFSPPHPLTPIFIRLKVTEQLRDLGKQTDEFIVTVVPILAGGSQNFVSEIVKCERITIVSYDK